jgi:hypothetical protein
MTSPRFCFTFLLCVAIVRLGGLELWPAQQKKSREAFPHEDCAISAIPIESERRPYAPEANAAVAIGTFACGDV